MPLYTVICTNDHEQTIMCKYSELEEHMKKCYKISCDGAVQQVLNMNNKPLVADRDLMIARNYNGKK